MEDEDEVWTTIDDEDSFVIWSDDEDYNDNYDDEDEEDDHDDDDDDDFSFHGEAGEEDDQFMDLGVMFNGVDGTWDNPGNNTTAYLIWAMRFSIVPNEKEFEAFIDRHHVNIHAGPWTLLMQASEQCRVDLAKILLDRGADVNQRGRVSLHHPLFLFNIYHV